MTQNSRATYFTVGASVGAGLVQDIAITGNYVACLSSNLPSFKLGLDGAPAAFMAQGLKLRSPLAAQFSIITVDNTGGTAQLNVLFAVGIGDITDGRFPSGDTLDSASLAGSAFSTPQAPAAPGAATFQAIGLSNAVANAVNGKLRQVIVSSAVATPISWGGASPIAGSATVNKSLGSAAGKLNQFVDNNAAPLHGIVAGQLQGAAIIGANLPFVLPLRGAIIIPPGRAFAVWCTTANNAIVVTHEWEEA
jgi:hypothetical protein